MNYKEYYLDSAAHIPMSKMAQKAYIDYQNSSAGYGHASSPSKIGREAANALEIARGEIAQLLGAEKSSQIIFTSTCTQACEWALSIIFKKANEQNKIIKYSPFEHPANKYYVETKVNIEKISLDGCIVNDFSGDYIICMQVQNEIGAIQPIDKFSGYLLSDMCQSVGKINIDLKNMNVDLATFAAHKFGGPASVGILYIKNIKDYKQLGYGSRYFNDRAGTPDVGSIVATAAALKETIEKMPEKVAKMKEFKESLENTLINNQLGDIIGIQEERVANISLIHIPEIAFHVLQGLSQEKIYVSVGSACNSKHTGPSLTMQAIGIKAGANDLLRISSNGEYNAEDGKFVAEEIIKQVSIIKRKMK